jgi:arylsulfatase
MTAWRVRRIRFAPMVVGLVGLAAAALGCGRDTPPELARLLSARRANCLVVILDAAAGGHFGTYGYGPATTPHLDAFAQEAVVFERAYSQAASTAISVPSYLTGLYPRTVRRHLDEHGAPPRSIVEVFRAAGFRTAGFSENVYVGPAFGLDRGFEHFELFPQGKTATERIDISGRMVAAILDWARARQGERFFAYVHLLRPHHPYETPVAMTARFPAPPGSPALPLDRRTYRRLETEPKAFDRDDVAFLRARYDANLFFADALAGTLLRELATLGILDDTLVVVTADHGEAFGQHGHFLHNTTLYDEMIRVPLFVRLPVGIGTGSARIPDPVGLVDLYPTLVQAFGLEAQAAGPVEGLSLLAAIQATAPLPARSVFSQTMYGVAEIDADATKVIVHEDAPHGTAALEVYALGDDPGERHDLGPGLTEAERARRLASVNEFLAGRSMAESVPLGFRAIAEHDGITPEVRGRLRALGYVD